MLFFNHLIIITFSGHLVFLNNKLCVAGAAAKSVIHSNSERTFKQWSRMSERSCGNYFWNLEPFPFGIDRSGIAVSLCSVHACVHKRRLGTSLAPVTVLCFWLRWHATFVFASSTCNTTSMAKGEVLFHETLGASERMVRCSRSLPVQPKVLGFWLRISPCREQPARMRWFRLYVILRPSRYLSDAWR